ncbi:MAG: hypothetical protein U5L04_02625 [Trueperaceae bacterium]|nr:hypothetical protein [Trueperaceae bacterium]
MTAAFQTSQREALLEALETSLSKLSGVNYVSRQAISRDLVADAQLPAIIIDESSTQYEWYDRHGDRDLEFRSTLVLDLQISAERVDGGEYNISTVRETFAAAVMTHLTEHAELIEQLDGESQSQAHARDVAPSFTVQYPAVQAPYARALVSTTAISTEQFDGRVYTEWDTLVADLYRHDDPKPSTPGDLTFTTE